MKRNKFFKEIFDCASGIQCRAFDDEMDITNKVLSIVDLIRKIRNELMKAVLHEDFMKKQFDFLEHSIMSNNATINLLESKIESIKEKQMSIAKETELMKFALDQKREKERKDEL